ncbi:uncharacterized protein LY79DRAFT_572084 [Colletotrichum navitas]|uniref:Uncharacterized protein n=1 Tax=Colletotrichum navitas TaxID=681940 RepID=A0AAD8PKN6_9PEZI|nr:uncharacterized protein LY79DRAFT_572084 [Colletotrichum navitas]KAK1566438.1 hypothetical protein LY79DRAFT_572084 [Colletotrichum navitas]
MPPSTTGQPDAVHHCGRDDAKPGSLAPVQLRLIFNSGREIDCPKYCHTSAAASR